jgi:hypothetical protein
MQVTFDCADPAGLAAFWASALPGYAVQPPPPGFDTWEAFLEANGVPRDQWDTRSAAVGEGPRLFFQKVPEPKTAKNRVHLDLGAADLDVEVARVTRLGATLVGHRQEYGITWSTFTDPEGNEFCIGLHPEP